MKFSEKWLREWVKVQLNTQQLAEQLTMLGLEVDSITPASPAFCDVFVGQITHVSQHPHADRLNVCEVDIGKGKPLKIVCGGTNVRERLKVPVAVVGAELPGNMTIKAVKLRDVESQGMICSETELGLAESVEGKKIMELADDAPVGKDFREYFDLDDYIIDLGLTPNRGDCLSIMGLAREIAAANAIKILKKEINEIQPVIKDTFPITLTASQACPRYVGRVITGINSNVTTPIWIKERLRRSGIRCIHPVVDVMNYVMLELGQPMHAFDFSKLKGDINVRFAKDKEQVLLLDGQKLVLNPEALVIADQQQVLAVAGIMGGETSSVGSQTTEIFLESAYFDAVTIAKTTQRYRLHSDSSYRFERGVDSAGQIKAMERATALLLEITGGNAGPVIVADDDKTILPKPAIIELRCERVEKVLGISIKSQTIIKILQRLGMKVVRNKKVLQVTVPSYRHDLCLEVDLIEEIARLYGYQNISSVKQLSQIASYIPSETTLSEQRIKLLLADRDYREAITYSFVDRKLQEQLEPEVKALALANPISSDMAVMRTNLWTGLLEALRYNLYRQQERIRLFEMGLVFRPQEDGLKQIKRIAAVITGPVYPKQWGIPKQAVADFYDIKKDMSALLALTQRGDFQFVKASHSALHPGKTAAIYCKGDLIGYLGELHPSLQKTLELPHAACLFEIDFSIFNNCLLPKFKFVSKFPVVRRDIALAVSETLEVQTIKEKIIDLNQVILNNVEVFDVYQGAGIAKGTKSVAITLTFGHPSRTLTDAEVNTAMQHLVNGLQTAFQATLRE